MGPIPAAVETAARVLGANLAEARQRRQWTQAELARKAGLSRPTIAKVERGNPGTSIEAYIAVLWAMGLHHSVVEVASIENDPEGATLLQARTAGPVRRARRADDDF